MKRRYHHFWSTGPENRAPVEPWRSFTRDVKKLYAAFPDDVLLLNTDNLLIQDHNQTVTFTSALRPDDEYAVFRFTSTQQSFAHCTTNWEPYDLLVTSILLAAKRHFGPWVCLTSDGSWDDWESARSACVDVLGYADAHFEAACGDFLSLLDKEGR